MNSAKVAIDHLTALSRVVAACGDEVASRPRALVRLRLTFTGSGDSLAAAQLAACADQVVISAGDLAWGGAAIHTKTLVALSMSGRTGATVAAARQASRRGVTVIAVTCDPDSPLAEVADEVLRLPGVESTTVAGCGAYVMVGLAVIGLAQLATHTVAQPLADALQSLATIRVLIDQPIPRSRPHAISICTLPELRSAGDFWSLKLIEATGLAARSVPLEEWGHADYFLGGQRHLDIALRGGDGRQRFTRLLEAMRVVGHDVFEVDTTSGKESLPIAVTSLETPTRNLALGAIGTLFADAAARVWRRPRFRGGAVDMSAAHIRWEGD